MLKQIAFAALVVAVAGCASGNYKRSAKTAAGLTESANSVAEGKAKIDAAVTALNNLVNNPQADLVPAFKAFNAAVADLQSTADHVDARVEDMRVNGNAYVKEWELQLAQIQNEDIRNRSAERRAEVQKKLTDVKRSYVEAETAFKPFMASLKDIQTALRTDLTSGGIASIRSAAEKTVKDAEPLKGLVDQLAAQFRDLGVAMASSTPGAQQSTEAR